MDGAPVELIQLWLPFLNIPSTKWAMPCTIKAHLQIFISGEQVITQLLALARSADPEFPFNIFMIPVH